MGIDLRQRLEPEQVFLLLDALSHFRILCLAGQDPGVVSLADFERFANHWGASVPHPSNFLRGGKPAQSDGATGGRIEVMPFAQRKAARVNETFPGQLQCLPHESPAIYVSMFFVHHMPVQRDAPGGTWVETLDLSGEPDPSPYSEGSDRELIRLRKTLPLNGENCWSARGTAPAERRRQGLAGAAGTHQPAL